MRKITLILLSIISISLILGSVLAQVDLDCPGPPLNVGWVDLDPQVCSEGDESHPMHKLSRLTWEAPVSGTPVVHYLAQVIEMGGADFDTTIYGHIPQTGFDLCVTLGVIYKVRVAGVDSLDHQGEWSLWTPYYGPTMVIRD